MPEGECLQLVADDQDIVAIQHKCVYASRRRHNTSLHNRLNVIFAAAYSADRRSGSDYLCTILETQPMTREDSTVYHCTRRLSPFTHILTTLRG